MLSARHVVLPEGQSTPTGTIEGISPSFPDTSFKLKLVRLPRDTEVDAVLLEVTNRPDLIAQLPAVNLGFSVPRLGSSGFGMGFPALAGGELGVKDLVFSSLAEGFLLSNSQFESGFSGGPAFNTHGLAVAMNAEAVPYRELTKHIPTSMIIGVIGRLVGDSIVEQLVSTITDETESVKQWAQNLHPPPSPRGITNLQLLELAFTVKPHRTDNPRTREKIRCVRKAVLDRGLGPAVYDDLSGFASLDPSTNSDDIERTGDGMRALGLHARAARAYSESRELLAREINLDYQRNSAAYLAAACRVGITFAPTAEVITDGRLSIKAKDSGESCAKDVFLDSGSESLFTRFANINQKIAEVSTDSKGRLLALANGINASALAAVSGPSPGRSSAILGDLYWRTGDEELMKYAAASYATAASFGYQPAWVLENLNYTMDVGSLQPEVDLNLFAASRNLQLPVNANAAAIETISGGGIDFWSTTQLDDQPVLRPEVLYDKQLKGDAWLEILRNVPVDIYAPSIR